MPTESRSSPAEKVLCPLLIVVGAGDWVTGEKPDIMPKKAALMAMVDRSQRQPIAISREDQSLIRDPSQSFWDLLSAAPRQKLS